MVRDGLIGSFNL